MKKILITGSLGQIGSELAIELRKRYGADNVVISDIRPAAPDMAAAGPFEPVDCMAANDIAKVVVRHEIDTIYHLAAILSARAEAEPQLAWKINMQGLYNALEVAREHGCALFTPSSIGAFGPTTPLDNTPQDTVQRPTSIYGVTKVAGELLCDYYWQRFGVDTRGVRYPGIISHVTLPGGGTTDYAVEIFYEAITKGHYTCFLGPETFLDMMYMPDAIEAAIQVMEADPDRLIHRNAFNTTAMGITPEQLAAAIRKHIPGFTIDYEIDPVRQAIADSWPNKMDDTAAREEWGWEPRYDLEKMTADMIEKLRGKLQAG